MGVPLSPLSPKVGVYKSTDGGQSWTLVLTGQFPRTLIYIRTVVVDPGDPDTVFAGSAGYGVYRSSDGGLTWQEADAGLFNPYVNVLVPGPSHTSLYAGTEGNGVFKLAEPSGPQDTKEFDTKGRWAGQINREFYKEWEDKYWKRPWEKPGIDRVNRQE